MMKSWAARMPLPLLDGAFFRRRRRGTRPWTIAAQACVW